MFLPPLPEKPGIAGALDCVLWARFNGDSLQVAYSIAPVQFIDLVGPSIQAVVHDVLWWFVARYTGKRTLYRCLPGIKWVCVHQSICHVIYDAAHAPAEILSICQPAHVECLVRDGSKFYIVHRWGNGGRSPL